MLRREAEAAPTRESARGGRTFAHPAWKASDACSRMALAFARELGLTPSVRRPVEVPQPDGFEQLDQLAAGAAALADPKGRPVTSQRCEWSSHPLLRAEFHARTSPALDCSAPAEAQAFAPAWACDILWDRQMES
jgi:hypothetical protein